MLQKQKEKEKRAYLEGVTDSEENKEQAGGSEKVNVNQAAAAKTQAAAERQEAVLGGE